jgi:inner membrane protein involved in colicin E2 resistance
MSPARLLAIAFIVVCTSIGWFVLGGTVLQRTGESDQQLAQEVAQLWGGRHEQRTPAVVVLRPRTVTEKVEDRDALGTAHPHEITREVIDEAAVALDDSRVRVALALDQRKKGLLWYATYAVTFDGHYRFKNPDPVARWVRVDTYFPSAQAIYDGFVFRVNGQEAPPATDLSKGVPLPILLQPGQEADIQLAYRSRGLTDWTYALGGAGVAQVKNFDLQMTTDFDRIDFPAGTISPTARNRSGKGWTLGWQFASLVTGQKIGMVAPNRLNPGPFAARVTFFAPVSLLFFVTVLVMLGLLRGRNLHPMNYFFLSAAFFAFHLLLAYLVDHVDVHVAFAIAAATSVVLVISYLRLVAGIQYALFEAGAAQIVFLILFSYAFFFEGYTGLTVTVGAVLTLFVLMQMTGGVDWESVFARRNGSFTRVPPAPRDSPATT